MTGPETELFARLEPGGRLVLYEQIMADAVMETPGCELWFNDKNITLGLRLLRGNDHPPYLIRRQPGEGGGRLGILDVGDFLGKVGVETGPEVKDLSCKYYPKYQLVEVSLGIPAPEEPRWKKGVMDDFPALED